MQGTRLAVFLDPFDGLRAGCIPPKLSGGLRADILQVRHSAEPGCRQEGLSERHRFEIFPVLRPLAMRNPERDAIPADREGVVHADTERAGAPVSRQPSCPVASSNLAVLGCLVLTGTWCPPRCFTRNVTQVGFRGQEAGSE